MKVKIGSTYLTGSSPAEWVLDGAALQFARLGEAIPRIRAAAMRFEDRANASNTVNFSVTRSHASADAAMVYMLTHAQTVSGKGTVTFESGASSSVLADALLTANAGQCSGCATTFSYTVTGGLFT